MNVTMTDRRAGKFEAKFFHKVSSFLVATLRLLFPLCCCFADFLCVFRFCKRKSVVLKDILDRLMLWHLILMGGGNRFCSTCLSNQSFQYLHLATFLCLYLFYCMLNDSTMLIMVIYAILRHMRMP